VQAKLDKLEHLHNDVIQPVQISEHFMKTWSSLTSKLNRPDDDKEQVPKLEQDKQNELFCRDPFRLRVLIVEAFYNDLSKVTQALEALLDMSDEKLTLFRAKPRLSLVECDWPRNINLNYWSTEFQVAVEIQVMLSWPQEIDHIY